MVITEGTQTTKEAYTELSVASSGLKNKGVILYAIGVGDNYDRSELEDIASGSEYVFTSPSFKEIANLSSPLRAQFCKGECLL